MRNLSIFSKSIFSMDNHIRQHRLTFQLFDCQRNDLELYRCKNCDFTFDSTIYLRKHIKEEHQIGELEYTLRSYICRLCSFETHSTLQWLKHSRCRNDEERDKIQNKKIKYECHECGSAYEKNNLLKQFKITHMDDKNRKWRPCNKCSFKTRNNIHFNEYDEKKKWYHCDKCEYKTLQKCSLKKHFTRMHMKDSDKNWFRCDRCTFKTLNRSYLKKHFLAKHHDSTDWFRCDKCTFKTLSESYLKAHFFAEHINDKNKKWLLCDRCEYKTLWKPKLLHHFYSKHIRMVIKTDCDKTSKNVV